MLLPAGLPGTIDEDDTCVTQRLGHEGLGMSWHQARKFDEIRGQVMPGPPGNSESR